MGAGSSVESDVTAVTQLSLLKDFFLRQWYVAVCLVLATVIANVSLILIPVLIGRYYDLAFGESTFRARLLEWIGVALPDTPRGVIALCGVIVLTHAVFLFAARFGARYLGETAARQIREALFAALIEAPLGVFDRKPVGKFLLRFAGDTRAIQRLVTIGIVRSAGDILLIAAILALLATLHPQLTSVLASSVPIALGAVLLFNRQFHIRGKNLRGAQSQMLAFVTSRLQGILSVKVWNRQATEKNALNRSGRKLLRRAMAYHLVDSLTASLAVGLLYLILLVMLILGSQPPRVEGASSMTGGLLVAYIMVVLTAFPFLKRTLRVNAVWQRGRLSLDRVVATLNQRSESAGRRHPLMVREWTIELRNVSFAYRPDEPVLDDLSCVFPGEALTKIVGRNGSGKSSILKLILGLYAPSHGVILVGEQDLAQCAPHSIRQWITLVSPEAPLVGRTVSEAVSDGTESSPDERIASTVERFNLAPILHQATRPDYKIGELGRNLSAGQRTALMLVRAFLTNRPIVLLDEPFTGLDRETRSHLWAVIAGMRGSKTLVLIDHGSDFDRDEDIDHTVILTTRSERAGAVV